MKLSRGSLIVVLLVLLIMVIGVVHVIARGFSAQEAECPAGEAVGISCPVGSPSECPASTGTETPCKTGKCPYDEESK